MKKTKKTRARIKGVIDIIGCSTRREILLQLALGPKYIFQLSKVLGVSQQAVMKHLNHLERIGIVECREERSPIGANRKYYRITRSFHVSISLGDGIYDLNVIPLEEKGQEAFKTSSLKSLWERAKKLASLDSEKGVREAMEILKEVEERIYEIDRERVQLLRLKKAIWDYLEERKKEALEAVILYAISCTGEVDVRELSEILGVEEEEVEKAISRLRERGYLSEPICF